MAKKHPITVAYGDGIGPEIMKATLLILEEAGAQIDIEVVEIGEKVYLKGHPTGIEKKTWESLQRTKNFLKGPITTPQGGGFKSLNVTIRTSLGLYANVRPCISYFPFIQTKHPNMDLVIIRENEEDLYTGIEYRQTPDVCHALKIISQPGSEKIIRYAFEYAKQMGRKKVSCFTKDNILKISDGLFHKEYEEIGKQYPEIEKEHWIIDIGAAKLADTPEAFDVVVLPNLYGDILSDVAAQISGSVGLAGSANIGEQGAMFEAIHGSAPKRAGQNSANPSGLLHGAIYMLLHIQQLEQATLIQNAWLKTIEDGIHTQDIFNKNHSKQLVGTHEFAKNVVQRLGQKPEHLPAVNYAKHRGHAISNLHTSAKKTFNRILVGVDVFIFSNKTSLELADLLQKANQILKLKMITNRGVRVWPEGIPETFCIDQWRCRFLTDGEGAIEQTTMIKLLEKLIQLGCDVIHTENLYTFDGIPGFSNVEK